MNACKNATKTSNKFINVENAIIGNETDTPNKNIKPISENITMWPADIFANKRIVNANGLINNDAISIGIIKNPNHQGAPPNKCLNHAPIPASLIAVKLITKKAVIERPIVVPNVPVAV